MPKRYVPTGKPRGRPPRMENRFDPTKFEAMVSLVNGLASKVSGLPVDVVLNPPPGSQPAALRKLTREELVTQAEEVRGSITQVVANFHHQVPELLNRLALYEPEKALKLYVELLEYQTPKLKQVENTGTSKVQHFIAVSDREERPAPIDVTPVEVG